MRRENHMREETIFYFWPKKFTFFYQWEYNKLWVHKRKDMNLTHTKIQEKMFF
jgi:hypothetical protein